MHFAQSAIPNRKERKGKEESGVGLLVSCPARTHFIKVRQ